MTRSCRLCACPGAPVIERADLVLVRCPACGFVSGWPSVGLDPADYYDTYLPESGGDAPVERFGEWLGCLERARQLNRLLEVGAGAGHFARQAVSAGWGVTVTELSQAAAPLLASTGAEVRIGALEQLDLPDGGFDAVVSLEVLEHVPAPLLHLRALARTLRPGGRLLLTTPSFSGLTRRRLGARWRVIDREHLGYFTPGTLRQVLTAAGFRSVRVRSRGLDLAAWTTATGGEGQSTFDARETARLRSAFSSAGWRRAVRDLAHTALGLAGLGDTLLAWAER